MCNQKVIEFEWRSRFCSRFGLHYREIMNSIHFKMRNTLPLRMKANEVEGTRRSFCKSSIIPLANIVPTSIHRVLDIFQDWEFRILYKLRKLVFTLLSRCEYRGAQKEEVRKSPYRNSGISAVHWFWRPHMIRRPTCHQSVIRMHRNGWKTKMCGIRQLDANEMNANPSSIWIMLSAIHSRAYNCANIFRWHIIKRDSKWNSFKHQFSNICAN